MKNRNLDNMPNLISNTSDIFLQYLVFGADQMKLEFPITISTGGLIISGSLISGDEYYSLLGQQIHESPYLEEGMAQSLQNVMNKFGKIYIDLREKQKNQVDSEEIDEDNQDDDQPRTCFYHLKNTRFYAPSGETMKLGSGYKIWRGNLDHIDGYTFGKLEPES